MKRFNSIIKTSCTTILLLAASRAVSYGQSAQLNGNIISASQFTATEMLQTSGSDYSLTTGRAAAMGGAFTALGGDMASIGINPAGLGMYSSSVWGFSPTLNFTGMKNNFADMQESRATRFGFNNIGTVLRIHEQSHGVISVNFGFSYNKTDDFNYSSRIKMPASSNGSILNILQLQLNGLYPFITGGEWLGLSESALNNDPFNNTDIYIDEWGAVLGYQSGVLPAAGDFIYGLSGIPESGAITSSLLYESRGSAGDYNIACGINIENIVYLGFNFGFRDIYRNVGLYYTEDYSDVFEGTSQLYLRQLRYNQYVISRGSAGNFKLGAIVRPTQALRIGIAYHSPTYTSLQHEYYAGMGTAHFGNPNNAYYNSLITDYEYSYNTPSRLLTGIAFTVGNFMAVSFDYERVWYNRMSYRSETYDIREDFRAAIRSMYRPADNFRVGLEIKPLPILALRAGYAYYDSPVRSKSDSGETFVFNRIFTTSSSHLSAGIGIWLGAATTLDIAYVYSRYRVAPYDLYYYNGPARLPEGDISNVTYTSYDYVPEGSLNRNAVTMTFNFMF